MGLVPGAGLLTAKLLALKISPALIGLLATKPLRTSQDDSISAELGSFSPLPIAASASSIWRRKNSKSSISIDALWSGPAAVVSQVKCFSIIVAPAATANVLMIQ